MINPDNCALIIIDIQGKLASLMHDREAFFQQTRILIKAAQLLNIPIIWAEQVPHKLGPTEASIAELLKPLHPMSKSTFSCCANPEFMQTLDKMNKHYVLVAGIETHICVYQTVADLLVNGKYVHVIADATSSRSEANKLLGLQRMQTQGAVISSVEMCLFEILNTVDHSHFRAISQLMK